MSFNIVLIEPEIPTNTGNIGRLALATGCTLHLVKPYGFKIDDSKVKRAGLDYWKHVQLVEYESSTDFFQQHADKTMAFFSSNAKQSYTELNYEKDMFLLFGKESMGLSNDIKNKFEQQFYYIPLYSKHIRSLNLANAVSVVVYEGIRKINFYVHS